MTGYFHEKDAVVKESFDRSSKVADRRPTGARRFSRPFPSFTIAESPRFHPHSLWSCLLRCQLASSISTGAAISEPNWTASGLGSYRSWPVPQSPELDDWQSTKPDPDYAAAVFICWVWAFRKGS